MPEGLLATKLYLPPPLARSVVRPRLLERLNEGERRRLTLVSAPAGFGKTTAVSEWVATAGRPVAWLSLDAGDSDPARFLTYLVAALQTIAPDIGQGVLVALQSPQPPPLHPLLVALLNELAALDDAFILVLDDYHVVDSPAVDDALALLLEHLPPRMRLVITTREDPRLPLARLRVRGQLTELRASDLRFTSAEAAAFLNDEMGLRLSPADVAALEARTEGWIAGLQLAAISMRGHDAAGFIASFTGTHRYVLDYLVEEVLQQQPQHLQSFLLTTSILDRLCGPLCDALLPDTPLAGQTALEHLERVNLFLVPLDSERRWYRYHHLFAELLRQRLRQSLVTTSDDPAGALAMLHARASDWFEANGFEIEAFQHAVAANDIERAERLVEGRSAPLYVRGVIEPVLAWLASLPEPVVHARPSLCVTWATTLAVSGQLTRVEPLLQVAEAALPDDPADDTTRDLIGRIAGLRALLAVLSGDPARVDTVISQSQRALEHLNPGNLRLRAATFWRLGLARELQGDRDAAREAHGEAIAASESSGNVHVNILASTCLGRIEQANTQLSRAVETFEHVLRLVGDPPGPTACEAYLGLARIAWERNDPHTAERFGQRSAELARQVEIANIVSSELFLADLQLARGDLTGAFATIDAAEQTVRRRQFWFRMPEIATTRVRALILRGDPAEAVRVAGEFDLPLSQARAQLAVGDAPAALAVLARARALAEERGWPDLMLGALVLEALAHDRRGDTDAALHALAAALAMAEPDGYLRTFVDEGAAMRNMLASAAARGIRAEYIARLLAAFDGDAAPDAPASPPTAATQPLPDQLSRRELEVLRLIAEGLSNRDIAERLFLALDTVKGHNRVIFDKLRVQRRTEAVARARELGLL